MAARLWCRFCRSRGFGVGGAGFAGRAPRGHGGLAGLAGRACPGGFVSVLQVPRLKTRWETVILTQFNSFSSEVIAKLIFESTEYTEYTESHPLLRGGLHFVFYFISSVWPRVARTNRSVYSVCSVDFKRVL